MPIDSPHPVYKTMLPLYEQCLACVQGEDAVKRDGQKFLPRLHIRQPDDEYQAYLRRAFFLEATGRTSQALVGSCFRKTPTVKVPRGIEELVTPGVMKADMRALVNTGRCAVLVDRPQNGGKSYFVIYGGDEIINWFVDSDDKLVSLVLREGYLAQDPKDEFVQTPKTRYRHLLMVDGQYTQRVYTQNDKQAWVPSEEVVPRMRGIALDSLPVVIGTSFGLSNTEVPRPPILPLAVANLQHYLYQADYNWGLHYTALPTPWVSGFDTGQVPELSIGSSKAWILPPQGSAGFLEFGGQGVATLREALDSIEASMASLGGRLLEKQKASAEAAETVALRQAGEEAVIVDIAGSASAILTEAAKIAARWEAQPDSEIEVVLHADVLSGNMDPQKLTALVQALQTGSISRRIFFEQLAKGNMLPDDWTYEQEQAARDVEEAQVVTPPKKGEVGGQK